jgi:ribonucleoside-diphosphate reductase alpha chain
MLETEWLGENNKIGIDIWRNKYRFDSETFDQWVERISAHNEEVADLVRKQKFLFGGRILANRGLEYA